MQDCEDVLAVWSRLSLSMESLMRFMSIDLTLLSSCALSESFDVGESWRLWLEIPGTGPWSSLKSLIEMGLAD